MTSNAKKRPSKSKIKYIGEKVLRFDLPSFCTYMTPQLQTAFGNSLLSWECCEVLLRILDRLLCLICSLLLQKGSDVVKCWGFPPPPPSFSEVAETGLLPEKLKKKQNLRQRDIHPNPKNPQPEFPRKNPKLNQCQENPEPLACKRVVLKFP